jgi:hypothetical protein
VTFGEPVIDDCGRFPERPPSEVEWEELLVKYEIAPRALAVAVSDVEDAEAGPAIEAALRRLLGAEHRASLLLAAMRDGRPVEDRAADGGPDGVRAVAEAFARLRERNFNAVQRRGIDVWEWAVEEGGTRVTPYRLILASVARDGRVLAMVRDLARGARA